MMSYACYNFFQKPAYVQCVQRLLYNSCIIQAPHTPPSLKLLSSSTVASIISGPLVTFSSSSALSLSMSSLICSNFVHQQLPCKNLVKIISLCNTDSIRMGHPGVICKSTMVFLLLIFSYTHQSASVNLICMLSFPYSSAICPTSSASSTS